MKASPRDRREPSPNEIKGTTGEQVGNPDKRVRKGKPAVAEDATSRYQQKTGQIKRDFGR